MARTNDTGRTLGRVRDTGKALPMVDLSRVGNALGAQEVQVSLDADDWEDLVVSTDPRFVALIERSRALHKPGTGTPLEEIRRKYGLPPKARRKAPRKPARKARSPRP